MVRKITIKLAIKPSTTRLLEQTEVSVFELYLN